MNEKERLLKTLRGEKVDRPPVICPGGMMNAAVTELLADLKSNHNTDLDAMVTTAIKVREVIGFENFGVPFCMTCEAEPLGVEISEGDKFFEPRIVKYNTSSMEDIMKEFKVNPRTDGRMPIVIKAIERLKNDEIPVIGNITGAISTATSIIDPLVLFKALRKEPEKAYDFIGYVNDYLIEYAKAMVNAGADVIVIADPTATGEILGKKNFDKFVIPMYKSFLKAMKDMNTPVIIHICGDTKTIIDSLNTLEVQALSFDSIVNLKYAKSQTSKNLMGNVSTLLLQTGPIERIVLVTETALNSGVDVLSPACGLGMSTPINNLRAMIGCLKGGK